VRCRTSLTHAHFEYVSALKINYKNSTFHLVYKVIYVYAFLLDPLW